MSSLNLNPFDWIIRQLYLWRFVPKGVWYSCKRDRTVLVVPARVMEEIFRDITTNANVYRGSRLTRIWTHTIGGTSKDQFELIFSDDPACKTSPDRRTGGVVGSLEDFDLFRSQFTVVPMALNVPDGRLLPHNGAFLGWHDDPTAILQVIEAAKDPKKIGRRISTW